jgi:hypothetical protein
MGADATGGGRSSGRPDRPARSTGRPGQSGRPSQGGKPGQGGKPSQGSRPRPASRGPRVGSGGRPNEKSLPPRDRPADGPPRQRDPELPGDISWQDLDGKARQELRSLPKELAERVGAQLAAAGITVDEDPEAALAHAQCARRLASRVAITREALGLTAYAAGQFDLALAELRTYRRMTGDQQHLPLMVDCERGLGRPERALELAGTPEAATLDDDAARELRIVVSGARRDLEQPQAAVALLESDPGLRLSQSTPELVRLRYAYADALLAASQIDDARTWFERVAAEDVEQRTDAANLLASWDQTASAPTDAE